MSMNIALRLNGQYLDFRYQTSTAETYRVVFENSHHLDAQGHPLPCAAWVPSSQRRRWGKLCHLLQTTFFHHTVSKRKAKEYFKHREGWEKRSWKEDRKRLWEYLVWIRDTPGMEITYT